MFPDHRYHQSPGLGPSPFDDEEARAAAEIFMAQSVEQLRAPKADTGEDKEDSGTQE